MKATSIFLLLLVWHTSFSQWTDNFDDGNFNDAPSWSGNTANFSVEAGVLRLTAPAVSGSSYLSTKSDVINAALWQFSCQLDFNPSSSNYAEIYLVSDSEDLSQDLNGYYVRLGSTSDDISLCKQTGNSRTLLIDGQDDRLSNSSNSLSIKVVRNNNGEFVLYSMLDGEPDWLNEGVGADNQIEASQYFGVKCNFTSTRSTKFYFDDFLVAGDAYQDRDAPAIDTVFSVSDTQFVVQFNEEVAYGNLTNTRLEVNGVDHLNSIQIEGNKIQVSMATALEISNRLIISGFADVVGNEITEQEIQFIHYSSELIKYGDIVINELMIDPSPPEDLPEFEYIELINTTQKAIYMTGWSLSDKVSSILLPEYSLLPNEIVLFIPREAENFFNGANIIGLERWVSLNNSSDSISLQNEKDELVDLVAYQDSWYLDDNKSSGGWSLERIDPRHPCSGAFNWQASHSITGGTPGQINSVFSAMADTSFPLITAASVLSQDSVVLEFSEPVLLDFVDIAIQEIDDVNISYWNGLQNTLLLKTSTLSLSKPYLILVYNLSDCFGNVNPQDSIEIVLPEPARSGDIVISEILFNPFPEGADFIELYNQSAKYIELNEMSINNDANSKEIEFSALLKPNAYLVLTTDTISLSMHYPLAKAEFSRTQELPQFNNDVGIAVLKNSAGIVIDSIRYQESWHFSYLTSHKGVSLERISPNQPGLEASNWVSGSSENNFATPGYANWMKSDPVPAALTISPQVIVPDADGRDDIALISIDLGMADALVTINLYNIQGQLLRELTSNALANRNFQTYWDGTDARGAIVPLGHYIVMATAVYDNGTTKTYREKLVVGTGF
jgi:hypothetical protein